jgi:GTP-binding protein
MRLPRPRSWLGKVCSREPYLLPRNCRSISAAQADKIRFSNVQDFVKFFHSSLSQHWDTLPPTKNHLKYAESLFCKHPPKFLWSAPHFHSMSFGDSPEVCFLGRSNVGKSSLLNALLNRRIAHTSSKPGRTRLMNAFAIGRDGDPSQNRLVVLDMPGYGKGGQAEWGKEILKYLNQRKQLKRAFILIDTVHGIKSSDEQLLALFRQQGVPHQIVLAKVDRLLFPTSRMPSQSAMKSYLADLSTRIERIKRVVQPDVEDESSAFGELIACSAEKRFEGESIGINAVRHAMLQAAGLEYQPQQKPVTAVEIIPHEAIDWGGSSSEG